jgi:ribosome-associated protein
MNSADSSNVPHPSDRELALHAARFFQDKGGEDVVLLALPPGRLLFDYVVIGSGRSERQATSMADEVYHVFKRLGLPQSVVEGSAGWRVVDCGAVVAHAMTADMRNFYDLERLWAEAARVDFERELAMLPRLEDPNKPAPR